MVLLFRVHTAVRRDAHLRSVAVLRIAGAAAADANRKHFFFDNDGRREHGPDALSHAAGKRFYELPITPDQVAKY